DQRRVGRRGGGCGQAGPATGQQGGKREGGEHRQGAHDRLCAPRRLQVERATRGSARDGVGEREQGRGARRPVERLVELAVAVRAAGTDVVGDAEVGLL